MAGYLDNYGAGEEERAEIARAFALGAAAPLGLPLSSYSFFTL